MENFFFLQLYALPKEGSLNVVFAGIPTFVSALVPIRIPRNRIFYFAAKQNFDYFLEISFFPEKFLYIFVFRNEKFSRNDKNSHEEKKTSKTKKFRLLPKFRRRNILWNSYLSPLLSLRRPAFGMKTGCFRLRYT